MSLGLSDGPTGVVCTYARFQMEVIFWSRHYTPDETTEEGHILGLCFRNNTWSAHDRHRKRVKES